MEMFNKSRAQEMRGNIDNLASQVEDMDKKLSGMKTELKERCPHPDDYVRKIDSVLPMRGFNGKKIHIYYCSLCEQTTKRKGN
jgi:archaellum component FlaC